MFFLFLISLPSAPDLALGKDVKFFEKKFFAERLRSGARQRIFFLFLKYFAECLLDGTRQRFNFFIISLPSAPVDALSKEEIF